MKGKVDKIEEEGKITSYRVQLGDKERIPPVSPTFGKFPYQLWAEWDKNCEKNFNGTRWMKAWHDHQLAKQSKKEEAMWNFMLELNKRIDNIESRPEEEVEEEDKDFVPTIGNPTPKKKKGEKE